MISLFLLLNTDSIPILASHQLHLNKTIVPNDPYILPNAIFEQCIKHYENTSFNTLSWKYVVSSFSKVWCHSELGLTNSAELSHNVDTNLYNIWPPNSSQCNDNLMTKLINKAKSADKISVRKIRNFSYLVKWVSPC